MKNRNQAWFSRLGWLGKVGAFLLMAMTAAKAYDLTPDRGSMAYDLETNNSYVVFYVWNIGTTDWGPVDDCYTNWANGQWRDEFGKRIGSVQPKTVTYQKDDYSLTNGWFTPNPPRDNSGCQGSLISRGWDDEYGNEMPNNPPARTISHSIKPTLHERLDPAVLNAADENLDNNEVWITTQWNDKVGLFQPLENLDLPAGTTTLNAMDSLFYGVYSTNSANGNININNVSRSTSLVHGNEKVGYQGRRMTVTLTGGKANSYTIQNGSKVRAEFLGQNKYGGNYPPD
jgi:hypothetical protein